MGIADNEAGPTFVDLFSGCGGFSLGAAMAGFRSLVSIEIEPNLQSAYRRNFPKSKPILADVCDIDKSAWRQFLGNARPDAVIGGPPCQGFSPIGKRDKGDPRNSLVAEFYRHIEILRPKFFIMENVEGLLQSDNIGVLNSALELVPSNYRIIGPVVVNAAHFGAATNRRRVIIVGYDPSEVDPITLDTIMPSVPERLATVREAISDLPSPVPEDDQNEFGWARYPARALAGLSVYARQLRQPPPSHLGWKEAASRHGEGFVSGTVATRHSKAVARRYAIVKGGGTDRTTKSVRLEWDGQCPTLRAGTGPEKGAFQAVRPLHPSKARVITVREAARLQGFPDWFVFHPTKWHSFRMLGNSVSPSVSGGLFTRIGPKLLASLAT